MRAQIGTLPVEITRGESAKFHRTLLLLHGLWTDAWLWHPMAAYLAHRGWESWAPSITTETVGDDADAVVEAVASVVATLPEAPIVITHDAGIGPGLRLAARIAVPAIIAIAPVVAGANGRDAMRWTSLRARLFGGHRVPAPSGARARAFLGTAAETHGPRLVAESRPRLRALADEAPASPPSAHELPGLVVTGGTDPVSPPATGAALAERHGWALQNHPGRGHFIMLGPGFEQIADDVHRWIVRTFGAEILALLEESEER
jgi:pimeloyl-ACP methyl ester carboxylesterase